MTNKDFREHASALYRDYERLRNCVWECSPQMFRQICGDDRNVKEILYAGLLIRPNREVVSGLWPALRT
jgi:hypothetical protein